MHEEIDNNKYKKLSDVNYLTDQQEQNTKVVLQMKVF